MSVIILKSMLTPNYQKHKVMEGHEIKMSLLFDIILTKFDFYNRNEIGSWNYGAD